MPRLLLPTLLAFACVALHGCKPSGGSQASPVKGESGTADTKPAGDVAEAGSKQKQAKRLMVDVEFHRSMADALDRVATSLNIRGGSRAPAEVKTFADKISRERDDMKRTADGKFAEADVLSKPEPFSLMKTAPKLAADLTSAARDARREVSARVDHYHAITRTEDVQARLNELNRRVRSEVCHAFLPHVAEMTKETADAVSAGATED